MGLNPGEHIESENLIVRCTLSKVIFRGGCGQKMHITIDEWKLLKKQVDGKIRKALRDAKKHPLNRVLIESPLVMPQL